MPVDNQGMRKIEVFRENAWLECRLCEVKKGEMFRMYEDGILLEGVPFIAASDGYTNPNGVGAIEADKVV